MDQAITLEQALSIFTVNGARSLGLGGETGVLKVGCWADFIVLDEAVQDMSEDESAGVEVRQTVWKGVVVYG